MGDLSGDNERGDSTWDILGDVSGDEHSACDLTGFPREAIGLGDANGDDGRCCPRSCPTKDDVPEGDRGEICDGTDPTGTPYEHGARGDDIASALTCSLFELEWLAELYSLRLECWPAMRLGWPNVRLGLGSGEPAPSCGKHLALISLLTPFNNAARSPERSPAHCEGAGTGEVQPLSSVG